MRILNSGAGISGEPALGVSGAFQKMHARLRRKAYELIHGKDKRPLDQTVDDEPMLFWINLGTPA